MSKPFAPTLAMETAVRAELLPLAQRGYAFLDQLDPNWRSHIEPGSLDMGDNDECGLAMYGKDEFDKVALKLNLTAVTVVGYGFFIARGTKSAARVSWMYRILTEIWQDLLAGKDLPQTLMHGFSPSAALKSERALETA